MTAWLRRQRWLPWLAGAVSLYVAVLLVDLQRSQAQLRAAAEARLLADTRQVAAVLADFLAAQRRFASELAEAHEIDVFLANRALGMSMRYGLAANLYEIEADFARRAAQNTVLGARTYQRLAYLDEDGTVLVDTDPGTPLPVFAAPAADGSATLALDDVGQRIVVTAAVRQRGEPRGLVLTVADTALLSRHLAAASEELGFSQRLVTAGGRELGAGPGDGAAAALQQLPAAQLVALDTLPQAPMLPQRYDFALRVPVAGGALSVVSLLPAPMLFGHITSRLVLYGAGGVPLALLGVAWWVDRVRRRTQRLVDDVEASNRSRAELADRNDALTREITRRMAAEGELRASEERYRTYVEHAPQGIFVVDAGGRYVDANPAACAMVGYGRDDLLALCIDDLTPADEVDRHRALIERVHRDGQVDAEIALRRRDGSALQASLRAITLPGGLVMGFCVDITARRQAEAQIRQLAFFDPLTNLPNRRLLMDRLRRALAGSARSGHCGALLMLDLDNFKDLNDTQGHDVGDRLLVEVAQRLSGAVREADTVSRLGGDEYVVVAEGLGDDPDAAARQAETIAEKLHRVLARPYTLAAGRPPHHSTPSIGVTLFRGQSLALDGLLKQADLALYQAKKAGRNTIRFFNPDMQAAIDARAAMESALREGLARDELCLHFQPQTDRDGRVIGAEALLRWTLPDGRSVSPAQFIPLAEDCGLILPIGAWVLEQACAQLRRWRDAPATRGLTLSINVSARQFHEAGFVELVRTQIARAGIDPSRLKLELTESVVLDRSDEVIARMHALKGQGVGFALDDFGTGYSSLSYLKRLPLDEVKIDKAFVRDIAHDPGDAAIVRAVLAMSHSLGLTVVAEGVETPAQHAFLLRHGCERFQGYLLGRPVPIAQWGSANPAVVDGEAVGVG